MAAKKTPIKSSASKNKTFVLDTNVILYDPLSIFSFEKHEVVLPITILEELDRFKKGNEILNFNAREFARQLDEVVNGHDVSKGIKLKTGGIIFINTSIEKSTDIAKLFSEDTADHRILAVCYNLAKKKGFNKVTLVSKDINLRMKAKSVGLKAEDYETGKIQNIDELYTGKQLVTDIKSETIDKLFKKKFLELDYFAEYNIRPIPNEYYVLKNGSKSALVVYDNKKQGFKLLEKKSAYGILPRNSEQIFALDALMNPDVSLVTLSGKAGTGKTLMALAAALEIRKNHKQILMARPVIPLGKQDIGFLPGDMKEKLDPYMQPLYDNLDFIKNQFEETSKEFQNIIEMVKNEKLKIQALAFIRGRSLPKYYFIIDEAQNLTPHEVKTIITRAGEGTKIILIGDIYQIDTPYLDAKSNGLTYIIDKMKGQDIYAHVNLEKGERSYLAELASNLL